MSEISQNTPHMDAVTGLIEVRKARRKITFWRVFSFLVLIGACFSVAWGLGVFSQFSAKTDPHIARIKISGTIFDDRELLELIEDVRKSKSVQAVLIDMNSPGGTTVGGEAIYEAVLKLKNDKPVVTTVGTLAASAGYMIAAATDYIVVRRSSIIGSIGVIFTYADATSLLDKIGIQIKDVKTGALKAEPSPYSKAPPEVEPALRELIDDTYQWFVDIVAKNRNLERDTVLALSDGKIYSGLRSVELKLADTIGGEETAISYLESKRNIEKDLPVLDWSEQNGDDAFSFVQLLNKLESDMTGTKITNLFANLVKRVGADRKSGVSIDGLSSIWHPEN